MSLPAYLDRARRDPAIRGATFAVLLELYGRLDAFEFRAVKQSALARDLRTSPSRVSLSLARLVHAGYLDVRHATSPRDRLSRCYRLRNPAAPERVTARPAPASRPPHRPPR